MQWVRRSTEYTYTNIILFLYIMYITQILYLLFQEWKEKEAKGKKEYEAAVAK